MSRRCHGGLELRWRAEAFVKRERPTRVWPQKPRRWAEDALCVTCSFPEWVRMKWWWSQIQMTTAQTLINMGAVGRTRKISDSDWLPLSFPWVTISTTGRDPSHFITQVTGCPNRWAEVEKIGPVLSTLAQIGHFKALPVDQELVRATAARLKTRRVSPQETMLCSWNGQKWNAEDN